MSLKEGILLIVSPFLGSLSFVLCVGRDLPAGLIFQGPPAMGLLQRVLVSPLNSTTSITSITDLAVITLCPELYIGLLCIYKYLISRMDHKFLSLHSLLASSLPFLPQAEKKSQIHAFFCLCSTQTFNGQNGAHPHWTEQSTLPSPLTQMLLSPGNALIDTRINKV